MARNEQDLKEIIDAPFIMWFAFIALLAILTITAAYVLVATLLRW